MTHLEQDNNVQTVAPLTNVSLAMEAMERATSRTDGLPGIVCLYGPSGFGKSMGAAYVANKLRAYHVEAKSTWQRKTYLTNILRDMGIPQEKTIDAMLDQVCEQLALSGRPLIIDEADYLVDKGAASLLMDIHEGSQGAVLVIGEERLPAKLKRCEKVHNRVLAWIPAQPADMDDCEQLSRLYAAGIEIVDDLLDHVLTKTRGCTRRIVVNIADIAETAKAQGLSRVDLAIWKTWRREIFTGDPPARRP